MEMPEIRNATRSTPSPVPAKKLYRGPVLEDYGDARDLTFGTTPGLGESGEGTTYFRTTPYGAPGG